ncbi:MAG: ASCH domain-containing protein [Pseudomonadota bacterium]
MRNEINENVLISLKSEYVKKIFSGDKTIELRRRKMHLEIGTTVWIYETMPIGAIVGSFSIKNTYSLAPSTIWRKYQDVIGVSRKELFSYFDGVEKGFLIEIENVKELKKPLPLKNLRSLKPAFQPPQFFLKFDVKDKFYSSIFEAI